MVNKALWEEGTEIAVDTEVENAAAGWALNYCAVNRVGSLVSVHIEATNGASAAALVTTLQGDFAPGDVVTDSTGNFTIAANGQVSFGGSTTAAAKHICQMTYVAGEQSP